MEAIAEIISIIAGLICFYFAGLQFFYPAPGVGLIVFLLFLILGLSCFAVAFFPYGKKLP